MININENSYHDVNNPHQEQHHFRKKQMLGIRHSVLVANVSITQIYHKIIQHYILVQINVIVLTFWLFLTFSMVELR